MKKATLPLLMLLFSGISILILIPNRVNAASTSQIQVDRINHIVAPLYGGLIMINDTVQISPENEGIQVENFSIGFSLKYNQNLCSVTAIDENSERLEVTLDTGLGVVGYYGVTLAFPNEGIALDPNQSYTFTVMFLFSDLIESSTRLVNTSVTEFVYTADFPLYPSLIQDTSCNVSVILPKNMEYDTSDVSFNITQEDEQYHLNSAAYIPRLSQETTKVRFTSQAKTDFVCFQVNKLNREVSISNDKVSFSELFFLESKTAFSVDSIRLQVPNEARNVSAFDELGKKLLVGMVDNQTLAISTNLVKDQARTIKMTYNIFLEVPRGYDILLDLSKHLRVVPKILTIQIVFPEGATVQSFPQEAFTIQRDVFQERLHFSRLNVTWLQNEEWSFTYSYTIFWISFRPTLWTTTIVLLGSIVAFAWQRPKAPIAVSVVLVPRKTLNEFSETYEEKKQILAELEKMKRGAQKGKISRRRYKIRKATLENRLSVLSKKLVDFQQKIMSGGAKYADSMRQLEIAETELDNIEADINRIEIRFKRGEISAQTYRRLLEDDLRRKERAKTTIDGVLLRLRE